MRHLIVIVDANERHRQLVADALGPTYRTSLFAEPDQAIPVMRHTPPRMIIVGQAMGSRVGGNFLKDLQKDKGLAAIPVIFIVDSEDIRGLDMLREIGTKDYLVKPYRRDDLILAVAAKINGKVEDSWKALEPKQRKALEVTLKSFNGLVEDLSKGKALSYESVDKSCAAVVEAIGDSDIRPIIDNVKDHDNFTFAHSLRMATFLSLFAQAIGLPKEKQILLASGGFLHDVGKIKVPREVLNKVETLTTEEWRLIRGHVALSQRLLATSDTLPSAVMTIATQHHERLDGSGYPLALGASKLNQLARMASIIDVFTALTDRHPYKRTLSAEAALGVMSKDMPGQLDQSLLSKFRGIVLDMAASAAPAAPAAGA